MGIAARVAPVVRAIAAGGALSLASPRARRTVLVAYYIVVLIALVLIYGTTEAPPPPFIYQGF